MLPGLAGCAACKRGERQRSPSQGPFSRSCCSWLKSVFAFLGCLLDRSRVPLQPAHPWCRPFLTASLFLSRCQGSQDQHDCQVTGVWYSPFFVCPLLCLWGCCVRCWWLRRYNFICVPVDESLLSVCLLIYLFTQSNKYMWLWVHVCTSCRVLGIQRWVTGVLSTREVQLGLFTFWRKKTYCLDMGLAQSNLSINICWMLTYELLLGWITWNCWYPTPFNLQKMAVSFHMVQSNIKGTNAFIMENLENTK